MKLSVRTIPFALALVSSAILGMARPNDHDRDRDDEDGGKLDHKIAEIVEEVDAQPIQEVVETLAGFGNRNSCSDTQGPGRGITPARDWIFARFSRIRRLNVVVDPFVHPNCPTTPTSNVMAWLPGTTHPERVVLIGGHYDSRTIGLFDVTSDAPGANDSGSQSSVVLELARALTHEHARYANTIVFVTFGGEEQGLFGSGSLAAKFASASKAGLPSFFQGSRLVAMLDDDIVGGDSYVN